MKLKDNVDYLYLKSRMQSKYDDKDYLPTPIKDSIKAILKRCEDNEKTIHDLETEIKAMKFISGGFTMSKADLMFKKLGYEKTRDGIDCWCNYENKFNQISFEKNAQAIFLEGRKGKIALIDKDVLQAINEKCKELGWL